MTLIEVFFFCVYEISRQSVFCLIHGCVLPLFFATHIENKTKYIIVADKLCVYSSNKPILLYMCE